MPSWPRAYRISLVSVPPTASAAPCAPLPPMTAQQQHHNKADRQQRTTPIHHGQLARLRTTSTDWAVRSCHSPVMAFTRSAMLSLSNTRTSSALRTEWVRRLHQYQTCCMTCFDLHSWHRKLDPATHATYQPTTPDSMAAVLALGCRNSISALHYGRPGKSTI